MRHSINNTEVYPAEFGQQYQVTVTASHKTGWVTYAETDTVTCDGLDPANPADGEAWRSPNGRLGKDPVDTTTRWFNPNLVRLVTDEATMNSGAHNCTASIPKTVGGHTRTCTFAWTEPLNIALTDAMIGDLSHASNNAHGADFWHVHKNSSGKATTNPHRHCATHDVNGDGDTNDPQGNDGACPGPNTNIPDLPWHPPLPNKTDKFWQTLENTVITTSAGPAAGAATNAALKRLARASRSFRSGAVGFAGFAVSVIAAVILSSRGDDGPVITIAGHTGCLNPPQGNRWRSDRWATRQHVITETKQTQDYAVVYKHIIHYCKKIEAR